MKKSWSRIFALTMGIPLLLAILAACGSGTSSGGGTTPTAASFGNHQDWILIYRHPVKTRVAGNRPRMALKWP